MEVKLEIPPQSYLTLPPPGGPDHGGLHNPLGPGETAGIGEVAALNSHDNEVTTSCF